MRLHRVLKARDLRLRLENFDFAFRNVETLFIQGNVFIRTWTNENITLDEWSFYMLKGLLGNLNFAVTSRAFSRLAANACICKRFFYETLSSCQFRRMAMTGFNQSVSVQISIERLMYKAFRHVEFLYQT